MKFFDFAKCMDGVSYFRIPAILILKLKTHLKRNK